SRFQLGFGLRQGLLQRCGVELDDNVAFLYLGTGWDQLEDLRFAGLVGSSDGDGLQRFGLAAELEIVDELAALDDRARDAGSRIGEPEGSKHKERGQKRGDDDY